MTIGRSMAEPGSLTGRIARNTGLLFGGKSAGALIGLVVLVILGKTLPPAEFGGLLLLHAYAATFSGLASFNSWQIVVNFGVDPLSRNDWPGLHRLLRVTLGLDGLGASLAAILAVALLPVAYTAIGLPEGYRLAALGYCALIIFNQTSASTGFLRLCDRFDLLSAHTLVMPLGRLAGVLACVWLGTGLGGFILVWFAAALLSYLTLPVLALTELARRGQLAGLFRLQDGLGSPMPGIWNFAVFSNLDATVRTASEHLPTLLAGALFGPGAAAIYRVSRQVADLFARAVRQFDRVVHPEIARLLNNGEKDRVARLASRSSIALVTMGLALAMGLALSGADLLSSLLGPAYGGAGPLVLLLLLAATLVAAAMPFHPILYAFKRPSLALMSRLCGIGLFLLCLPVLAGPLGLESLGWAAVAGEALGFGLVMILARHSLHRRSGQPPDSASRTRATSPASPTPELRSGGPGQPASANPVPSNVRGLE